MTAQTAGLGNFAERGFTLEHDGDDFVFLMHEGESIARFMQIRATPDSLQTTAAEHLKSEHTDCYMVGQK